MRLRLRLLWILLTSFWRMRIPALEESVLSFRVLPNDIDVSKITDDRYVTLTDLGRLDVTLRTDVMKVLLRRKLVGTATFATIRYRHPLSVFQKYALRSRVVFWDAEAFYFQHVFERQGRSVATAYVRVVLLGRAGVASPATALAEAGQSTQSPEAPAIVAMIRGLDDALRDEQRQALPGMHA